MTFIVADRVQETTNSPGTGTATLLGAVSGYQSFSTGIGANNTTFYVIADQLGTNWEVGLGALNSTGNVLTRTTVYSSSNGGGTVNFATGTQYVWCDFPASKSVLQGAAANFSSIGATTAGTGAFTTLSASSTVSGAGFSNYFAAPPTIGNITPNAGTFTALVATSITDSGLTAGRVNYNGVGGLLQDSANMTFDGSTLTTLNTAYTGTLTGGTGVVNLGSGQFYKDASGNVGIGTASPSYKLDVNGQLRVYAGITISPQTSFLYTVDGSLSYYGSGNGVYLNGNSAGFLGLRGDGSGSGSSSIQLYGATSGNPNVITFFTNSSERMRIDSNGNLFVGTTSSGIGTARGNFWADGTNAGINVVSTGNGTSVNGTAIRFYSTVAAGATSGYMCVFLNSGGTIVGSITSNGSATIYNTTSDYRLKNVIGSVVDAGQRIDALEPIEYDWNAGGRTRGFLAHKFAEVYPNSVTGGKDAVDANGKPIYQSMQASSSEVMADLIAEIQSLRKRISTLEAK